VGSGRLYSLSSFMLMYSRAILCTFTGIESMLPLNVPASMASVTAPVHRPILTAIGVKLTKSLGEVISA